MLPKTLGGNSHVPEFSHISIDATTALLNLRADFLYSDLAQHLNHISFILHLSQCRGVILAAPQELTTFR
jgi:hypothetical protein